MNYGFLGLCRPRARAARAAARACRRLPRLPRLPGCAGHRAATTTGQDRHTGTGRSTHSDSRNTLFTIQVSLHFLDGLDFVRLEAGASYARAAFRYITMCSFAIAVP